LPKQRKSRIFSAITRLRGARFGLDNFPTFSEAAEMYRVLPIPKSKPDGMPASFATLLKQATDSQRPAQRDAVEYTDLCVLK
jgi:hypothetical protein